MSLQAASPYSVPAVTGCLPPCAPAEGCLVEQQVRLQRAQHVERQYLAKAFQVAGPACKRGQDVCFPGQQPTPEWVPMQACKGCAGLPAGFWCQRNLAAPAVPAVPAAQRVGDLERRRAAVAQASLSTFVRIYRSAVVPMQEMAGECGQPRTAQSESGARQHRLACGQELHPCSAGRPAASH